MLQYKILILERAGAINTRRSSTITINEVTTLTHEIFNLLNVRLVLVGRLREKRIHTTRWNLLPL